MKELNIIQTELNAPKDKYNSFGKYAYRSAEGIMEALKPLLRKTGCILTFNEQIFELGDSLCINCTATLKNANGETISTATPIIIEKSKKGMTSEQVVGSALSYVRKYTLQGMFLIDDNKDPDTEEYANQQGTAPKQTKPQPKEFNPEPVATAPLESQNVANLFPAQDMPDTIMDDLSVKILAAKNGDALKEIWKDAQVLLAQRPDDMKKIKSSILKRHKDISDGKSN